MAFGCLAITPKSTHTKMVQKWYVFCHAAHNVTVSPTSVGLLLSTGSIINRLQLPRFVFA